MSDLYNILSGYTDRYLGIFISLHWIFTFHLYIIVKVIIIIYIVCVLIKVSENILNRDGV